MIGARVDAGPPADLENALEPDALLADVAGRGRLGARPDAAERDDIVLREALLVVAELQPVPVDLDAQRRRRAGLVPIVVAVLHQLCSSARSQLVIAVLTPTRIQILSTDESRMPPHLCSPRV